MGVDHESIQYDYKAHNTGDSKKSPSSKDVEANAQASDQNSDTNQSCWSSSRIDSKLVEDGLYIIL